MVRKHTQETMNVIDRMNFRDEYMKWELINNETGKVIMKAGLLEGETHPGKMIERIRKFPNIEYTLRCIIDYTAPVDFGKEK